MYRYVQKNPWVRHCFVSIEKGSVIKREENVYLRNLKPECQKQSKAIIEIN